MPRDPHLPPPRHPYGRGVLRCRPRCASCANGRYGSPYRRLAARRVLPARRRDPRCRTTQRRTGDPSRLRLPLRECRLRRCGRGRGPGLHRPESRVDAQDGVEGRGQGSDVGRGRAGRAGLHRNRTGPGSAATRGRPHRLSADDQGRARRRRQGHAHRALARRIPAQPGELPARGEKRVRPRPRAAGMRSGATVSCSNATSRRRVTSRSRSSATASATRSI